MSLALISQLPSKLLSFSSYKLTNLASISTSAFLSAGPLKGGGTSLGKKRFRRPPKSTDAEYIVSHVAGSNYLVDGEDVKIKDDSEYPDWIWNLNLGRPKQPDELEFGTKEYWESVLHNNMVKYLRLKRNRPIKKKTVDPQLLKELEWKKRIRFRALASDDIDTGFDPEDYKQRPDKKMLLRPNRVLEEEDLYPDELLSRNPEKFIKFSRASDYVEQLAPRTRTQSRGRSGSFPSPSKVTINPENFLAKLPNFEELVSKSLRKQPAVPRLTNIDKSQESS